MTKQKVAPILYCWFLIDYKGKFICRSEPMPMGICEHVEKLIVSSLEKGDVLIGVAVDWYVDEFEQGKRKLTPKDIDHLKEKNV